VPSPSLIKQLRDILILPFTVTVIVPILVHNKDRLFLSDNIVIRIIGFILSAGGLCLFFYTVYLFNAFGKGTLAPWAPTQKLIILGPYKYCRNPMITGVLFILAGESLVMHSTNIAIWAVAFFLINTTYFILLEEPSLQKRFGEDYQVYKIHVPRWIPRIRPYNGKL